MPHLKRLLSIVCGGTLTVVCALVQADDVGISVTPAPETTEKTESVSESRRGNICFGGLENGKLIRNDDRVDNPFRQTSLLGCSVEGGQPVYLPDLKPAIPNGVLA